MSRKIVRQESQKLPNGHLEVVSYYEDGTTDTRWYRDVYIEGIGYTAQEIGRRDRMRGLDYYLRHDCIQAGNTITILGEYTTEDQSENSENG